MPDLLIFQKQLETVLLLEHLTVLKDLLIKKKVSAENPHRQTLPNPWSVGYDL